MKLSDSKIRIIYNELKKSGISDHLLQDELCDHICCEVEKKLSNKKISFNEAYNETIASFGENGLIGIQKQTQFQLFEKYRPFRNLLITSFIVLLLGFFLKLFHLPFARISHLIATMIYFIAILRLSFLILKEKSFPKYRFYFGLVIVFYFAIWITTQKLVGNTHPASYLFIPVIFFFGLLCSFHFYSKLRNITNTMLKAKYLFFICLSVLPSLLCMIDLLDLLRIIKINFTYFFFWAVIIEFVLTCIYLFCIRYFKNIAVLTLLLSVTLFYLPLSMPVLLSKVHINKSKQVSFIVNIHQKTEKNLYLIDKSFYLGFDKITFQKKNDTTCFLDFEIRDKWQLFYAITFDDRNIKDIMRDKDIKFKKLFVTRDTLLNINY